jgi:predicted nucleic acid-binding protein
MIFVDSNIPMYLVGADHPNKPESVRLLTAAIDAGERLVTDAEVLQEILHRYHATARRDAIQPAFDAILSVVDEVFPVDLEDVERAREILLIQDGLSARDALHAAVMERQGVRRVLSFDAGFDDVPWLERTPAKTPKIR